MRTVKAKNLKPGDVFVWEGEDCEVSKVTVYSELIKVEFTFVGSISNRGIEADEFLSPNLEVTVL